MISEEFKCIFVHIPKTGGDSVEKSIWKKYTKEELFGQPNYYQTGGMQHLKAVQIEDKIGKRKFNNFFKFSFVRNPYSRAVSQYFYTIHRRPDLQNILKISSKATFSDYVKKLAKVDFDRNRYGFFSRLLRKHPKLIYLDANYISKRHIQWEKQHTFLFDADGRKLVDFVGKFENLQEDYNKICDEIGISRRILPHNSHGVKKPKNKHYTDYYDDETKAIIEEIYQKDIELFKYNFG